MKLKQSNIFLLSSIVIVGLLVNLGFKKFDDPNKEKLLLEIVKYVVEKGHFQKIEINDALSEEFFYSYIEQIDSQKRFFLKSDISKLEKYKYDLDDQVKNQQLDFFEITYEIFQERIADAEEYYKEIISSKFDFTNDESINLDFKNISYARSKSEIKDRWRKQLKLSVLDIINLKIDDSVSMINNKIYDESIITVKKNTDDFFEYVSDIDRDDWFSNYINTFLSELDPHSAYFSSEEKEKFDTSISGKFNGIGARLQKTEGKIKIVDIIVGGPIWNDNLLDVGDFIIEVGQENEDLVDITSMKLDDAIKLIKGPADTYVTLRVKKIDGQIKNIKIKRGIVELEELYAKSTLIKKNDKNYGYISLPKFYIDFNDKKSRNSANDVKNEIIKLKNNNINGLILDLRNNGGGSLKSVVDMTGLFIEKGPVVQVKSLGNRKKVLYDKDPNIFWEGPLVVLMNKMSASASEILAGALQDYGRAVIIGNENSFGKGTVQNVVDLNSFVYNSKYDLGALKITTDKFYRINGESVQLEGVKSDIIIPDSYKYIFKGEKGEKNPLTWDKIDATNFNKWNSKKENFSKISLDSQIRIDNNEFSALIEDRAMWIKNQQNNRSFNLNLDKYRKFIDKQKNENKKYDNILEYENSLIFKLLKSEKDYILSNKKLLSSRNKWHKNLSKDLYVAEGVNALEILGKIKA
tara:strand:+ start:667 stop:2742 length:2076 start_codon:yes stop_codon:yes gene_type:complete